MSADNNSQKPRLWLIILFGIVLFFGTGLAVTYFNEDVGMSGVQDKIFFYISGHDANSDLLTLMFCIGVAAGVIIFFNPFMMNKPGCKPTPMETKYFEYQELVKQMNKAEKEKGKPPKDDEKGGGTG